MILAGEDACFKAGLEKRGTYYLLSQAWPAWIWRKKSQPRLAISGLVDHGNWVKVMSKNQDPRFHVVAYDFGVKHNILRMLDDRGCGLTVVPATTPAIDVIAMNPDGVFLSNGPGDPEPCTYAIEAIQQILATRFQFLVFAWGINCLV